ncbi:MAG: carboxypeptidase-like regulatory domain-containing protein, partial [Anaerolineales bacterium]
QETGLTISGRVRHGAGLALPAGLPVILHIYDTSRETDRQTTLAAADGSFAFTGVPPMPGGAYLVSVEYGGVTYVSAAAFYDDASVQFDLPVTIYESTADFSRLRFQQVHTVLDFSTRGLIQVYEIYLFTNPGDTTVTVATDGTSIPFIQIPAEAGTAVTFQLTENSAPLYPAVNGFAILPGQDLQYGITARFSLPYERRLVWDHTFLLPVETLDILVPPGVKVRGERLSDRGLNEIQGTQYRLYEAASLAAGEPLELTISGQPGQVGLFGLGGQSGWLLGIAALGMVFIAAGVFLFLRDRARQAAEEEETAEDALGSDPQALMDAIIALDDQYRAGGLSEKAYRARRRALKERLKELL